MASEPQTLAFKFTGPMPSEKPGRQPGLVSGLTDAAFTLGFSVSPYSD